MLVTGGELITATTELSEIENGAFYEDAFRFGEALETEMAAIGWENRGVIVRVDGARTGL